MRPSFSGQLFRVKISNEHFKQIKQPLLDHPIKLLFSSFQRVAAFRNGSCLEDEPANAEQEALTELFLSLKTEETPAVVERIVADIDAFVRVVRFDGWQQSSAGEREVQSELRKVLWLKYKLRDQTLFDKAYAYIKEYY